MSESHNKSVDVPGTSFDVPGLDGRRNPGPRAPPRRADAGHRQARRACRCIAAPRAAPIWKPPSTRLRFGLPRPPVLAHRLDKDTSGCLVLGRHRKATASLGLLFKHGKIGKTYWAVVEGGPAEDEGTIDMPLGRLNAERGWWQKPDPEGQKAVTNWKVLRPRRRPRLARAGTGHRPHPSIARAHVSDGLADRRRQHLRQRPRASASRACICIPARS